MADIFMNPLVRFGFAAVMALSITLGIGAAFESTKSQPFGVPVEARIAQKAEPKTTPTVVAATQVLTMEPIVVVGTRS